VETYGNGISTSRLFTARSRTRYCASRRLHSSRGAGCRNFSRPPARGGSFSLDILFYRASFFIEPKVHAELRDGDIRLDGLPVRAFQPTPLNSRITFERRGLAHFRHKMVMLR
jgi:hypothetical protein